MKNGRQGLGYTMVAGAEVGGNACPCASPFLASLEVVELLSERRGALDPLPVRLPTGLELVELVRGTAMGGDIHPRAST